MPPEIQTICVVGLGYIGLPTAATLAAAGFDVQGADISEDVVDEINEGRAHFSEPDLDMLVKAAVTSERLKAFPEPQPADAFILAVPTPIREDKSPDMSYVAAAARDIAKVAQPGNLVIIESTCPLGATERVARILAEGRPDLVRDGRLEISVAYCPERILPGQMIRELVENDRIVGGITRADAERARSLYERFVRGEIHLTDAKTAELVKLIENAYRDVNIAFANEIANLGEAHGLNAWEAITLANRHPRVNILRPGPGVGGHCIAVDPWFLIAENRDHTALMAAAREVNEARPGLVLEKIERLSERVGSKKIACLGLAFKPDIDDLRESPAVHIAAGLAQRGFEVFAVEPHINALPDNLWTYDNIRLAGLEEALTKADLTAVLVAHKIFVKRAAQLDRSNAIDAVGLWGGNS